VGKKLYVGNLSYGTTDSDLQNLFGSHGTVQSAQVIMDRDTGGGGPTPVSSEFERPAPGPCPGPQSARCLLAPLTKGR
jgi:hypothetical protein